MKTLDELAIEHQTDRASVFTRTYGKPHDYARHYDKLFAPFRGDPVKLLEVGIGGGEGMKMWMDYFYQPGARFFGVDTVCGTNDYDTDGKVERYCFHQGDQCDANMWERFSDDVKGGFDIIIDDGLHSNIAVITTFNALWQHVKPGGFYAIEDLNVAYGGLSFFVSPDWPNQVEFLKGKIDELNKGNEIDSVYFSKELAVLRKAML